MNKKESFQIEGLAGNKMLSGIIHINGAKNSALKAMASAILFDGSVELRNIPCTEDIHTMVNILNKLGAQVNWLESNDSSKTIIINTSNINTTAIDSDMAKTMRSSVVLTGPLLARFHNVTFPAPGGCVIGARPIDLFIDGYKKMGAEIELDESNYLYKMKCSNSVNGTTIFFDKISVGATETLMMTAILANGNTILKNCAVEPEIENVALWLNECGAKISGIGTSTLEIEGTNGVLLSPKVPFITIPDRIEAGSYLILGALCAKNLILKDCRPDHMELLISLLKDSGVPIDIKNTKSDSSLNNEVREIHITNNIKLNSEFQVFNVKTQEYPGFPTDLQAQIVTFLTQATGDSNVLETIFEGRFKYVEDLSNMGAEIITMNPREIIIKGPTTLRQLPDDEELSAHDIRAGFAIVLAALLGTGNFNIINIHLIDRGYVNVEETLQNLGANIRRVCK